MRVAITVDTEFGGGRDGHRRLGDILDRLVESGVRATFFVQGAWARDHPALLRRAAAEGHLIGNHSYRHLPLGLLPAALVKADVAQSDRAIREVLGCSPRPWFRCPYGNGAASPRVIDALRQTGYVDVGWTVHGSDWTRGISSGEVFNRVMGGCDCSDGALNVVLLHSWPAPTAHALGQIISALQASSAEFSLVDALPGMAERVRSMEQEGGASS